MTSWRNVLPIHPACDLFPMLSPEELRALGEDIKKNGLKVPIVVWAPSLGEPYQLLDGRNRLDAMELAGINFSTDDQHPLLRRIEDQSKTRRGLEICLGQKDDHGSNFEIVADPYKFVLSVNLHRRHLTGEQRRDLIAKVLKAKPSASNRQIAKQVHADDKTVGKVRAEMEARADIPHVSTVSDTKGRKQPSSKPKKAPAPAAKRNNPPKVEEPHQIDLEEAIAAKPAAAPAPVAAMAQATLFEPDIEGGTSDEGLNPAQLKAHNKRLRGKLKTLRKHIAGLEDSLRNEKEQHRATWSKLDAVLGDFSDDKVVVLTALLGRMPNKVEILEKAFWGFLEDEQDALLKKIGARP